MLTFKSPLSKSRPISVMKANPLHITLSIQPLRMAGNESHASGNWKITRSALLTFSCSKAMSLATLPLATASLISDRKLVSSDIFASSETYPVNCSVKAVSHITIFQPPGYWSMTTIHSHRKQSFDHFTCCDILRHDFRIINTCTHNLDVKVLH